MTAAERSAYDQVVTEARHLVEEYAKYAPAVIDDPIYLEIKSLSAALQELDNLRTPKRT